MGLETLLVARNSTPGSEGRPPRGPEYQCKERITRFALLLLSKFASDSRCKSI